VKADRTGWDDILEPGEAIKWQGSPNTRFRIKPAHIRTALFGLAFSGFALFWMITASQAGGYFWMFGLLHFSVGLCIGFGPVFWDAMRRKNTWYTLTDQRAFIATDMPVVGRRIKSHPITGNTVLDLQPTSPPSIFFAHEFKQGTNYTRRVNIGFEGITDAAEVLSLMRDIQKADLQ